MDFPYLAKVAAINAATIRRLASAPAAPAAVMLRGALGSDTTVTWPPVSGAASYRIYWRRADEHQWTDHIDVAGGSAQDGLHQGVAVHDNFVGVAAIGWTGTERHVTFGGRAPSNGCDLHKTTRPRYS